MFERALDVDHRSITLWLRYAEMEMKNRQVNHARNVLDRAVTILPRCNQFWYKYTYMEEMLGSIPSCRQVFERWMAWEPEEQAWATYINFEVRYNEIDRAREIHKRFISIHPEVKNWLKFARFEEKNGSIVNARDVYERAVEYFGDQHMEEVLLTSFAKFEERQKEHERVKAIYRYGLEKLANHQELLSQYTLYEKKYGERADIEDVILSKQRLKYEKELEENPHDYDVWFDYIHLVENEGDIDSIRRVYERAIANIPPRKDKRLWRRYIYLWIYYAVFEELTAEDMERTRAVYQLCLNKIIPHKIFTFAKMWIMAAMFEVRQKDLIAARKILGTSIGHCPKNKLFREYINFEMNLREFDRCRTLYQKYVEFSPENCTSWIKFAELETLLGENERARTIYEIAISQERLDMPEVVWKAFIDFEIDSENFENARNLFERLLERTQHVKVWISFARFELSVDSEPQPTERARAVFRRANKALKKCENKEVRFLLLEAWQAFEREHGSEKEINEVQALMPRKIKKRRKIPGEDGGWEEYFEYLFPEDETLSSASKILEISKKWKQQMEAQKSNV